MGLINVPISGVDQVLVSGQLVPSGEALFFDGQQYLTAQNFGINKGFPTETTIGDGSGIIETFPENTSLSNEPDSPGSGIFNREDLASFFSNAAENIGDGINDFTIFNNYIHFERSKLDEVISIPYVSTYTITGSGWRPYGGI